MTTSVDPAAPPVTSAPAHAAPSVTPTPSASPAPPATPPGTPAAPAAPAAYALALPQGTQLDAKAVERTTALATSLGLSSDHAQKTLEFASQEVATYRQTLESEALKVRTETWPAEVMADPELGGNHFAQTTLDAAAARKALMSPEFDTMLNETGLGNHKEMVRFAAKVGRMLRGDTTVIKGDVAPTPPQKDQSTAAVLYGGGVPSSTGTV